jgi:hypothetical protein
MLSVGIQRRALEVAGCGRSQAGRLSIFLDHGGTRRAKGPYDEQRSVARRQPLAYDGCCGRAKFRPTPSSPDLPDCPSGRTCSRTLGSLMMGVLMVVKASRPGRDAGKGVCWDTRDANKNQGGNRDNGSKRHDQFLPQTA